MIKKNNFVTADILDFLSEVKDETFDLILTSPPYNKQERNNGGLVKKVIYDQYKDKVSETEYQEWQISVINELYKKAKKGSSFFYNHKVRYINGEAIHPFQWLIKTNWKIRQEIIWNRNLAGNIRGWRFWPIDERIYWLYKPKNKKDKGEELDSKHALLTSIWNIRPENSNKEHPAPFPVEIPLRIIFSIFGDSKNKLILDPFSGSGTTAIASKILGHDYIGVDISKNYNEIAEYRINNLTPFLKKWDKEKELHNVFLSHKERKLKK